MMVIRVLLNLQSGCINDFIAYMDREAATVRQMPGCLRYQVFQAPNTTEFLLYEEWATRKDFDAYLASDVIKAARTNLIPMLAEPPNHAYYDAQTSDGPG